MNNIDLKNIAEGLIDTLLKAGNIPQEISQKGVKITTEWYKDVFKNKKDPFKVTINQILEYMNENNWC